MNSLTSIADFDTISDDDLVALLGLDEASELFTNTFNGRALIAVCDGAWVKSFGAEKWYFKGYGACIPMTLTSIALLPLQAVGLGAFLYVSCGWMLVPPSMIAGWF